MAVSTKLLRYCYKITYNFITSGNLNKSEILYPQKRNNTNI